MDGDLLVYLSAWRAESEGIDILQVSLEKDILFNWVPPNMKPKECVIAFSCKRANNFRRKLFPDYKANRDRDRPTPEALPDAIEYVKDNYKTVSYKGIEADDIIGMLVSRGTHIGVSLDKDLRNVPGWHFNPDKELEPVLVSVDQAERFFHTQWLTGDRTDNIPGLWKIGPAKAARILDDRNGKSLTQAVLDAYAEFPDPNGKPYDLKRVMQYARAVRILRDGEYKNGKVKLWELPKKCKWEGKR